MFKSTVTRQDFFAFHLTPDAPIYICVQLISAFGLHFIIAGGVKHDVMETAEEIYGILHSMNEI